MRRSSRCFFTSRSPSTCLRPALRSLALFVLGGGLALVLYWKPVKDPIHSLFAKRLYIDDFYNWLVRNGSDGLAMLSGWADRWVVDLFVVQLPARFTGLRIRPALSSTGQYPGLRLLLWRRSNRSDLHLAGMISPLLCLVVLPIAGAILMIAGTQARTRLWSHQC